MNATALLIEANGLEDKIKHNMHLIHFILTLLTGVWVIIWDVCALMRKSANDRLRARIRKLERQAMLMKEESV